VSREDAKHAKLGENSKIFLFALWRLGLPAPPRMGYAPEGRAYSPEGAIDVVEVVLLKI